MSNTLLPLSAAPIVQLAAVHTVLTDIDDTLTSEGRLPAIAYGALEMLEAAGLRIIPLTGRPAGWCDLIARFWPVAGVVGENGAFTFRYDRTHHRMIRHYARNADERARDRLRLEALSREILAQVPGAALAADQGYRIADLAIDFREDVPPLGEDAVARIVALFEAAGATAKVSSIHVNGWFGTYDKLSAVRAFLTEAFGLSLEAEGSRVLFIGDSPNDAPLFSALPLTVGVANVRDFTHRLPAAPRYVTSARGGEGFAELAAALLRARDRP